MGCRQVLAHANSHGPGFPPSPPHAWHEVSDVGPGGASPGASTPGALSPCHEDPNPAGIYSKPLARWRTTCYAAARLVFRAAIANRQEGAVSHRATVQTPGPDELSRLCGNLRAAITIGRTDQLAGWLGGLGVDRFMLPTEWATPASTMTRTTLCGVRRVAYAVWPFGRQIHLHSGSHT
jgi:hypothetical protein